MLALLESPSPSGALGHLTNRSGPTLQISPDHSASLPAESPSSATKSPATSEMSLSTPKSNFGHPHGGTCNDSVIHTANLSTLDSLDHVLTSIETDISPWQSPMEWIHADMDHLNSVIQDIILLMEDFEIDPARFTGQVILYPRLIIYIFAHLMVRVTDKRLLNQFKETLQKWKSWDNITVIKNHQLIKDYLVDLFRRGLQPLSSLHSENLLQKLLNLDSIGPIAHLTVMVTDDSTYAAVIAQSGPGAQVLLNTIQACLDSALDSAHKFRLVKALIKLSRASGLYPECLFLKGIQIAGDSAVAEGGFGDVYKGQLGDQEIAIKVLKVYQKSDMQQLLKKFLSEAVTWRQLSHPNVLPFYGICHMDKNPLKVCLACPWMENGNIVQFLHERPPDTDCILLSLDIAQGLEYLHNKNIIHGDLKGVNILVSPSRRALLADFGLATTMESKPGPTSMNRTAGTPRWQAPELFPDMDSEVESAEGHNTFATDIYAYGLVCYEIFSGRYPFCDVVNEFQVMFAVKRGKRPSRPTHTLSQTRGLNDEIWHLIETCWTAEPFKRPTASQIVEQLHALPNQPVDRRSPDKYTIWITEPSECPTADQMGEQLRVPPNRLFPSEPLHKHKIRQGIPYGKDLTGRVKVLGYPGKQYSWLIGNGAFTDVMKGEYRDGTADATPVFVAVKICRVASNSYPEYLEASSRRIVRESKIWLRLSHPNILPYLGYCLDLAPSVALISPLCVHGSITTYVAKYPSAKKLQLIEEVARGLEYLHSQNVIHADIHSKNILIDREGHARLADFGRAKVFGEAGFSTNLITGFPSHMAPELFSTRFEVDMNKLFSKQSDVHAFAMACFEIFTNDGPFTSYKVRSHWHVLQLIEQGKRPQCTPHVQTLISRDMWMIMESCWTTAPESRLSAEQIVRMLVVPGVGSSWNGAGRRGF